MSSKRVSPVNCSDSATTSQNSNGSNTLQSSTTQRRLTTVSPSTSPRSTSFYGSSPSNVNSGQYWAPVASRNKFKTWSKGGSDKRNSQGSVQLTSTGTSTSATTNMPTNPALPSNVPNASQQAKPKRERPTTKSMSIQSFEAHQQKLEQINRVEQTPPRATTPPFPHREPHNRRPRSQSTNSNIKQAPKQTQFYRKKKPMLVDAVTQTTTDASTQTSEDDLELAMSLYRKSPYPETFHSISAPSSTPTTNTVSTQTNTFTPMQIDAPVSLKGPAKDRITATASMQRSLSTNTMNIQINLQEFEELQKQLTKFQQHKEALLSKSRPVSFTAAPSPTAVKINSVNITFPQPQLQVPQPQIPQPQIPQPQVPQPQIPRPPSPEDEEVEQLGPSQRLFHSADAVLNDLNDLEEEIAFMRYKALSLQESVQWLQREKSSRPIAPGPPPPVEFTDSKTLAVNTPKKVEPNKPEKRPNTPFDFMLDLQGPDQSKRQNIASQGSAFTTSASIGARLNKTRMSQSLT
eukprot:CAMPEP_0168569170 /NCGR_PEP_ID=MMETSP0413-20121227/15987_1 /TAXON_ID=136452 /ORGANISM="Filamoeba nolandi, Strain NC-AS-23-1" /LENGTH=517 /DNA_ID=CAMNT_0008601593 /DNA_START=416 /DNA_END=1966 /DNA_ORIENTATION=+